MKKIDLEKNLDQAIALILEETEYKILRLAVAKLSKEKLMRLAQATHGQIYRELERI